MGIKSPESEMEAVRQKMEVLSKIFIKRKDLQILTGLRTFSQVNDLFVSIRKQVLEKLDKEKKILPHKDWLNPHSREAMIERKMKNNATKKYPKDFRNAFVERAFETTFEDYDQYRNQEKTVLDYTDDRAKTVDEHEADIDEKTGVKGIEKKRFSDSVIPVRSDPKKGDEQLLKVDASTGETDEGF